MTCITTTFPFQPVVDDHTFDNPNHSYSQELTNIQQNRSPLVPNCYPDFLLRDPLRHAHMFPIPSTFITESGRYAPYDLQDMPMPSLSNYLNPLLNQSNTSVLGFTNGEPPYNIPRANQPHLHQADETTPETPLAPGPPGVPYPFTPSMTRRPRSLPEPTNTPLNITSAFGQTQIQAAIHPPPTSTALHEFGGNAAALSAPPVPLATVNLTTDHLNAVHTCRCVTDGSPCDTVLIGSVQSVRDHLNRVHRFRGAGKDMVECLWAGCKKRLQRENVPRHIVTCHLRVKVRCVACGLPLSRRDVQYSHAKACRARRRRTASLFDADASSAHLRYSSI